MVKLWIIRALFLLPLACVVGVYIASYFVLLGFGKQSGERDREINAVQGLCDVYEIHVMPSRDAPLRVRCFGGQTAKDWIEEPMTLGFYGGRWEGILRSWRIIFPLWLPALVLAGANGVVWRKTRRRSGRGFPVEAGGEAIESPATRLDEQAG